ncbi:MAG: 2-C-methyl-D-erythritol 2,4-cyclodiphosphate synthase [Candidatus Omnitrophota bacterium]
MRIGLGYDIHRFSAGRKLFIGGIEIPSSKGLLGHSDADVLIHALCDALLGAMGQADIGHHFPDTDQKYKDVSSLVLLEQVRFLLEKEGYEIENIDTVVLLEAPKIAPYKEKIKECLSACLKMGQSRISIKATTHEGVGEIGRGEAAAAHAVVLIKKK